MPNTEPNLSILPPRLIPGGVHRDARGLMQFVNGFTVSRADRFYVIHPANVGEVRGWIGHRRDGKWFFPIAGRFAVGVVCPDNWVNPARDLPVMRFSLDAAEPALLEVPAGHYAAITSRAEGSILAVFSTGAIATAKDDDFRLPADYWQP